MTPRHHHHPPSSAPTTTSGPRRHHSSLAAFFVLIVLQLVAVATKSCEAFQTPSVRSLVVPRVVQVVTSHRTCCSKASFLQLEAYSSSSSSSPTRTSNHHHDDDNSRRRFLSTTTAALLGTAASGLVAPLLPAAHAGGLIQFPCDRPLKNRYHFMRAGWSELEHDNIYSTNPLFLTNRENQMMTTSSTNNKYNNRQLIQEACDQLVQSGNPPTVAYHSLAANGIDTADLVCQILHMGRDRVLPEFTYLDQRAIGLWDSGSLSDVQPAIWALDVLEAGREGTGGKPPPAEDGTPNETLADQFVRLRQFLSLQESRTSGENILIIFPDGTGPALLSAMIAGIPYQDCHALHMEPGSLRMEVTKESILELYQTRKNDPTYLETIERGKETLAVLRQQTSSGDIVNQKTQRDDKEREALDAVFEHSQQAARDREEARQAKLKADVEARQAREEAVRQKQVAAKQEVERQKEVRQQQQRQQQQQQQQQQTASEIATTAAVRDTGSSSSSSSSSTESTGNAVVAAVGVGIAAAGVLAAVGMGGGNGESETPSATDSGPNVSPTTNDTAQQDNSVELPAFAAELATELASSNVAVAANGTIAITLPASAALSSPPPPIDTTAEKQPASTLSTSDSKKEEEKAPISLPNSPPLSPKSVVDSANSAVAVPSTTSKDEDTAEKEESVEEELQKLEAAQDAMDKALMEDATSVAARKDPVELEMDHLEQKQEAMNSYFDHEDGGSNDWLQVLAEIRDAPEEAEIDNDGDDFYNNNIMMGDIVEEDDGDIDISGGSSASSADL